MAQQRDLPYPGINFVVDLLNARPSNWHVSTLDTLNADALLETLEVAVERTEVE